MTNKLMDTFENTLNQIRDILRKEGITGMDSIKHCLAFVIARTLTSEKCKKLKIETKYSFENLMKIKDQEKLFELFYKENDECCIIGQIYIKMNFSTDFKLDSKSNLKNILDKISAINIDELSANYDIVGIIYELHLKSGTSQAMRDLGQYFTNRAVIDYMVKLCDPKIKKNGDIETILDPAMGTAGFLAMSIKRLNEQGKINWLTNKNNIYGFDIDENVKNMAKLNLFLETGEIFDKTLTKRDTLHKDLLLDDNKTYIDKVDVILANEPFGIKGLKYADCCERIKKLKIDGTKAEPLFLQLMMQSLNKKGRCAVVVPDGVLFNDAKLHTETRKYLVENFNLKKISSLDDGLFLNTGVKSSILFFINDGKTEEVEFVKIKLNNTIEECNSIKVDIDEIIKNDYSLFVNKYNKVEEEKINGIQYKKLGDVCEFKNGKTLSSSKFVNGIYPVIGGGKTPSGYHNEFNCKENTILCSSSGANAGYVSKYNSKVWASDCFSIIPKNKEINNLFLYYYLLNIQDKIYKLQQGSAQPHVYSSTITNIEIPIPPLTIQNQIVEALDVIHTSIEDIDKNITNYEMIKKSIIWSNTISVEKKKLSQILKVKQGDYITKNESVDGIYGVYGGGDATYYIDKHNRENKVIIAKDGVSEKCVRYIKEKFFLNHHAWTFELIEKNINEFYVNNWLLFIQDKIYNLGSGSAQKGINQNNFLQLEIPIPSKETQEYIVKECEYYDNLINMLKEHKLHLQNNKVIETVLKSVSLTSDQNQDEIKNESSNDEEDKIKATIKKEKKTKEVNKESKNIEV